jgi:peptidoglycan hydrolase-like protein with peptidoglycan-binding domain
MPYTQQQRQAHIRELQRMLYALSFVDDAIPKVIPDGIYGRETAQAVRAFQQRNNLHPTGETNRATWDEIVRLYLERVAQTAHPVDAYPHASRFLTLGDEGLAVYIVQAILNLLGIQYENMQQIPVTGKYDATTQQAVREFQKHSGQKETGNTDPATWNLLHHTVT